MALYIYGTVFNNANRLKACINSVSSLSYKKLFVTDNYSTDGTYEILKNLPKIEILRKKCSHGLGRQLALEKALSEAEDDDFVMYIDFDTIFNQIYIDLIKEKISTLKDNEVFIFGMLSKAKINRNIQWRDLLTSEDLERHAHFKHEGYNIVGTKEQFMIQYGGKGLHNPYYENDVSIGDNFYIRHKRYKTSRFKFMIRMLRTLIDDERGAAFKSFRDFYKQSNKKNIITKIGFFLAYLIAKALGIYSYDSTYNNIEYVMASAV